MPTMKPILYALSATAASLLIATTSAPAGSGVGGVFNLGQTNTVDQKSTLAGAPADAELLIQNTGTGTALSLMGGSGAPSFKVNSDTKIANLNSDQLDGLDSAALQKRVTGTCAAGQAIRIVNADGTVSCQAVGGTGGWSLTGNAGTNGSNFLGTTDAKPLVLKVNGEQVMRITPASSDSYASDTPNVIAGSPGNHVFAKLFQPSPVGATIAGGGEVEQGSSGAVNEPNVVNDHFGTVSGGLNNQAGTSTGGLFDGAYATVAGGSSNQASGNNATVAGGAGNIASGDLSAIPGGVDNFAGGISSFAAGTTARATEDGSFVWGDLGSFSVTSPAANSFTVRAGGGIWLGTTSSPSIPAGRFLNTSTGGYLSSAGAWTNSSDRARKRDFRPLNTRRLLEQVARMPIRSWSYKAERRSVRHIGPVAQDFHRAFGLGLDDKHITTVDESGVALAAVQALYRQNRALRRENRGLHAELGAQARRLTRIEHLLSGSGGAQDRR